MLRLITNALGGDDYYSPADSGCLHIGRIVVEQLSDARFGSLKVPLAGQCHRLRQLEHYFRRSAYSWPCEHRDGKQWNSEPNLADLQRYGHAVRYCLPVEPIAGSQHSLQAADDIGMCFVGG